ncbi:MAG TPA: LysM peptidoglycan-binding domain-containing protein [Pyrinomonadaceae bacterium]|nr:LysM peptidoglycan-binding domain-containing protein [Pyrinomonadaceae bacterium]
MALAKLTIAPIGDSKIAPFKVLFNPTSYSIAKSVSWETPASEDGGGSTRKSNVTLNAPLLQFGGGQSRTLSLKLFFDVTDYPLISGEKIKDVRNLTNQLVKLTLKERSGNKEQPPPVCRISWGESNSKNMDFPFVGVVESLTQEFTLFDSDGRPLRANLDVSFKEFLKPEEDKRKNDPEFTTLIVKRGDTLSSIAAEMLNDPARWRIIADANQLDNPRALEIGRSLSIPKVQ